MSYWEKLQAMDIIVVYNPKSWLHRIIGKITGYKAGHVALYVGDGKIYEAASTGVHRRNCKKYGKRRKIYICRVLDIKESQEIGIRNYCFECEHVHYAFLQLVVMLFQYIFRFSKVPDVSKKAMICSELVANAFSSAGIKLCDKKPWETTPADIIRSDKVFVIECQ